jgi:hypothetical protein
MRRGRFTCLRTTPFTASIIRGSNPRPSNIPTVSQPLQNGTFARQYTSAKASPKAANNDHIEEWTTDQICDWLRHNTEPQIRPDLLEAFQIQDITGLALARVRPPTLFEAIKRAKEEGGKMQVDDRLLQDTLLSTAFYSMQKR